MEQPLLQRLRQVVDPLSHGRYTTPSGYRTAAVLLLFDTSHADLPLLFLQRTNHLHHHPGQIAFPGGLTEPQDADAVATALRETSEEVGVTPDAVSVIGMLPPRLTATSDRWLTPIVGLTPALPPLVLDTFEVQDCFSVTLSRLAQVPHRVQQLSPGGSARDVHFYDVGNRVIWGVTGAIVYELLSRLDALAA